MFQVDEHTIESFTWAALTVWGRGFDLGNATTTTWGMVPFADFANHAPYVTRSPLVISSHPVGGISFFALSLSGCFQ